MNITVNKTNIETSDVLDKVLFNYELMKRASEIYRAINNSFRKQLLQHLIASKQLTVTELYVQLNVDQSVVSQHLSILRRAKIVLTNRVGKNIYYSINYSKIEKLNLLSEQILN